MKRWVVCLGLLALLLPLAGAEEPGVEWRPYAGYLPDQDWKRAAAILVRDAATGEPVEGARVQRCPECVLDPWGGWAPAWEETFTDEYGLAWIELDPEDVDYVLDPRTGDWAPTEYGTFTAHWAIDAPGYAPTEEYGGSAQEEVELEPGTDLHGRLLNVFGRPAAGVRVEFKVGCAHAPALRTALTDTSGHFVLACVAEQGDVCYEGPGVCAEYLGPGDLAATDLDPPTILAEPGAAILGRIVGPNRAWLAEASVLSRTSGRGPLARVSPDGFFRLEGADRGQELWLKHPDGPEEIEARLAPKEYGPGEPFVWQHPAVPETDAVETEVQVRGLVSRAWSEVLTLFFDRQRDGRRFRVPVPLDGESSAVVTAKVPPGTYRLSAGEPLEAFVAAPRTVEVVAGEVATFAIRVAPRPRLELTGRDALPKDASVHLCLADRAEPVPEEEEDAFSCLPADAEAAVVVRHLDGARSFPVGAVADGVRRAQIDWSPPTVVEVRGYRYDEKSEGANAALPVVHHMEMQPPTPDRPIDGPDGFSFRTYQAGRVRLSLWREDAGRVLVDLDLPATTGGHVVLEDDPFPPGGPGVLHVERRSDDEEEPPYCVVNLAGESDWLEVDEEDGAYRSPLLRDGARVRVGNHHQRLSGPGPYRVTFGRCTILLVVGSEGTCEVPVIYVDGQMWGSWESTSEEGLWLCPIRGLDAGSHRLIVGAEDHLAMRADVVLGPGEESRLSVVLPVRPRVKEPRDPRTEGEWWALLDDLADADAGVRRRARRALVAAGERSLPWLIGRLTWSPPTSDAWRTLLEVLTELRPEVTEFLASGPGITPERLDALTLWRDLHVGRTRAVDAWVALLRAKTLEKPMRASAQGHHARLALSSMGAASLPTLVALLDEPEPRIRFWALRCLVDNPAVDDALLFEFTERLVDEDVDVRRGARTALLSLARSGRVTVAPEAEPGNTGDAIVDALVEPNAIEDVLVLLEYFPARPSTDLARRLMTLLDGHRRHHDAVIEMLGRLGTDAQVALPVLERIVETAESWRTIDLAEAAILRIKAR